MKKQKRILALVLATIMLFSAVPLSASAASSKTSAQALAYVQSKEGQKVGSGECVALIDDYYTYLGYYPVSGNGGDYDKNCPSGLGWAEEGGVPQPGDILVYKGTAAGHVAIYESEYVSWHQRWPSTNYSVKRVERHYAQGSGSLYYWGCVHINFASETPVPATPTITNLSVSGSDITVEWNAVDYATEYLVDYWNSDTGVHNYFSTTSTSMTKSFDSGLYGVRVAAKNSTGESYTSFQYARISDQPDYTYTVTDGNATITGYTGEGGNITIPSTIDGYPVTAIGSYAFEDCNTLISVTLPDSVISIAEGAFCNCKSLISVTIPNRITSIESKTFFGCGELTTVKIPNGVTNIGSMAFRSCTSLTSITIPDSVTSIGMTAFYNCSALASIVIPDSVTVLGPYAFEYCDSLESITIGSNVTNIGTWTFGECPSLKSIIMPNSVTNIEIFAFAVCDSLTDVYYTGSEEQWNTITIKSGNEALTNATIHFDYVPPVTSEWVLASQVPTGVQITDEKWTYTLRETQTSTATSIAGWSRGDWEWSVKESGIYDHIVLPASPSQFSTSNYYYTSYAKAPLTAYGDVNSDTKRTVSDPQHLTYVYWHWCRGIEDENNGTLNNGIWHKPYSSYDTFHAFESTTPPGTGHWSTDGDAQYYYKYEHTGTCAATHWWYACQLKRQTYTDYEKLYTYTRETERESATEVANGGNISNVQKWVKYTVVESPIVPEVTDYTYTVTDGEATITGYTGEGGNITIPSTIDGYPVVAIGEFAFSGCDSLVGVTIGNNVKRIGECAFFYCDALTDATIEATSIGNSMFFGCESLKNVTIGDNVTNIGEAAFWECFLLTNLTIGDNVSSIGESAFWGCSSLTSVTIPDSVTSIEDDAFYGCSKLKSVTIGNNVNTIGDGAFFYCASIENVTIGNNVNSIGSDAFKGCASLTDVHYIGSVEEWNNITIGSGNEALTNATIHFAEEEPEAIALSDSMVNYRLRCTTAVVDGNLVLTADPAGTSSMKVRLGNLPEGATVAIVGTNANASMSNGIITVTNPGMKNVNVPMVITSANGVKTEFVLVADFNNAIRYATYARLSQTGNDITVTSGAATAYVLFDTTEIDGGYVEVTDVSRNLLGRYVISGSAVRFYNPVYDDGTVTVNIKDASGETVETYNVTAIFADATKYTAVLDTSLRCTYEVDGDNITVTAQAGVSNVYLNFGRYYSESLSASVNNDIVKKMGARSWRVMAADEPIEFDLYFDATAYGAEKVTRHVTVNF